MRKEPFELAAAIVKLAQLTNLRLSVLGAALTFATTRHISYLFPEFIHGKGLA
jgi:hypothetical protein